MSASSSSHSWFTFYLTLIKIEKIEIKDSAVGANNSNSQIRGKENFRIEGLQKSVLQSGTTKGNENFVSKTKAGATWSWKGAIGTALKIFSNPVCSDYLMKVPQGVYFLITNRSPPMV